MKVLLSLINKYLFFNYRFSGNERYFMSLTKVFFDKRHQAISRSERRGYEEIESFLERHELTMDDLLENDLVEHSPIVSSATIFFYSVTEEGREYLAESRRHQFIAVRPDKKDDLLDRIDGLE